jgi:hypothetical protein
MPDDKKSTCILHDAGRKADGGIQLTMLMSAGRVFTNPQGKCLVVVDLTPDELVVLQNVESFNGEAHILGSDNVI